MRKQPSPSMTETELRSYLSLIPVDSLSRQRLGELATVCLAHSDELARICRDDGENSKSEHFTLFGLYCDTRAVGLHYLDSGARAEHARRERQAAAYYSALPSYLR